MLVKIGRTNGPCNDCVSVSSFAPFQLDTVKEVLCMINDVSNNKEGWYLEIDGKQIVPVYKD